MENDQPVTEVTDFSYKSVADNLRETIKNLPRDASSSLRDNMNAAAELCEQQVKLGKK